LQQLGGESIGTGHDGEIIPATGSRVSLDPAMPGHSLKFNYDATTPLVKISLSIHSSPNTDVDVKASVVEEEVKVVYTGVHEGGFNQLFTLPSHAALDLSDAIAPLIAPTADESTVTLENNEKSVANVQTTLAGRESQSEDTNRSSLERSMGTMHIAGATQPDLATVPELGGLNTTAAVPADTQGSATTPRRFGIFPRRTRQPDLEAGQIEMTNRPPDVEGDKQEEEMRGPEKGMRVLIRIEAVGAEGEIDRYGV